MIRSWRRRLNAAPKGGRSFPRRPTPPKTILFWRADIFTRLVAGRLAKLCLILTSHIVETDSMNCNAKIFQRRLSHFRKRMALA